jgi:hypothetical protein
VTAEEFVRERRRLVEEHAAAAGISAGVESKNCTSCVDCMFSSDCHRCYKVLYSTGCTDSSFLTQSQRCADSHQLVYCEDCDHCARCNYVIRSSRCFECDYCFGCVGLVGKDFHILNRPYRRGEYFRIVKELREALATVASA